MRRRKEVFLAIGLIGAFVLWTICLGLIDVKPIGPQNSHVGFAVLNQWFHRATGVHMFLYHITDWLSIIPFGAAAGFALLGLMQWTKRRKLLKVDYNLLVLGGFYIIVMAVYLFFEMVVINHRPVLIDGQLEVSYPSSTTMLVLCVMSTAAMQLKNRIRNPILKRCAVTAIVIFTVLMTLGRLLSGVHWLTDIIGGSLLSAGLVTMYHYIIRSQIR